MSENVQLTGFEEFLNVNNLKKTTIAEFIGVSNGFITQITNGKRGLPKNKLLKIIANKEWDTRPLTGDGEMLKTDLPVRLNEPAGYRLVPMYNLDARGGFASNEEVDTVEYIVDHIPFKDARQEDICVMVTGNSMAPTYCAGSVVLLHPIDRWKEFLELGQVYVIILEDGRRLIKELRTSEEDKKSYYLCRSHNPNVDPVELPKTMIQKVFIVAAMYSKTIL